MVRWLLAAAPVINYSFSTKSHINDKNAKVTNVALGKMEPRLSEMAEASSFSIYTRHICITHFSVRGSKRAAGITAKQNAV